jgi:hypothetical protein
MASTKTFSNKNTITSESTQNLWCRDTYWQHISTVIGYNPFKETNGCRLRQCQYGVSECRGAHCSKDIKPLKHISSYNRLDKTKYNWVQLYFGIITSLENDSSKVLLEDHKRKFADASSMNLIELIQFWRELACYYRKIQKEIPFKRSSGNAPTTHSSGFKYSDDVPTFYLNGTLEDTAWAFERITRYCQTHKKMETNLSQRKKITVWDLCLATGLNCKEGVHYQDEYICHSDFLTGTCSCPTKEFIEGKEIELQLNKIELTKQLTKIIEVEAEASVSDEWSTNKQKKSKAKGKMVDPKQELRAQINEIDAEIDSLSNSSRMIHYTELGMIPFETQLENFRKSELIKESIRASEEVKPAWDHGIETIAAVTKPVVKVTKLGGKKK